MVSKRVLQGLSTSSSSPQIHFSLIVKVIFYAVSCFLYATTAMADLQRSVEAFNQGNYLLALEEASSVSKEGTPEEQFMLGDLFYASRPFFLKGDLKVWADLFDEGICLFELAAKRGNVQAMEKLAKHYHSNSTGPYPKVEDVSEALRWAKLAAEKGSLEAKRELGKWYEFGDGVPKNIPEAVKWYHLAAEQGDVESQADMAWRYFNGDGVPKDYILSHMWSNLAAAHGNEASALLRDSLEGGSRITPEQIAEAQRLAREWMIRAKQKSSTPQVPPPQSEKVTASPLPLASNPPPPPTIGEVESFFPGFSEGEKTCAKFPAIQRFVAPSRELYEAAQLRRPYSAVLPWFQKKV